MKIRGIVFALLSIALLPSLPAQNTEDNPSMRLKPHALSLDSCVQMALRSNKELQAAQHQANKYMYTHRSLRANYFPKIKLMAADFYSTLGANQELDVATPIGQYSAQRVHDFLPFLITSKVQQRIADRVAASIQPYNPELSFDVKNVFLASLTLEQPIYTGGKITAASRMGAIGEQMATMGQQLSREEVIVAVYEGYQLLVKAKEMKVVAQAYDSLLTQLSNDVASAVRHGMASHNDEMKVMVKKNDAELKLRQADNGIRLARMNLCQLIGLPLDSPIDAEEQDDSEFFAQMGLETTTAACLVENRTDYQLLDMKIQLAEQKIKLERSEFLPQVGLTVQGSVLDGIELMDEKLFKHKPFLNIGAVVTIPLFNAGEGRNKVRAAKEELEQSRMEQQNLVEKMNLELQQHANDLDEAMLELSMRKRNMEQCAENLRISRKSYDVGMEPLSELLTAQLLWQQAYADMVEARYQVKIKTTRWRKAAGMIGE